MTEQNGLPVWWSDKARRRTQNRRSASQERRTAAETGGRTQPGSGSSWRARGDVKTSTHLIECKYTDARRFTLDAKVLLKLIKDARDQGKGEALIISFESFDLTVCVTEYR